ncbi:MAG: hypothetical protein ACSHXK_14780 [Oceanococcus sp.]
MNNLLLRQIRWLNPYAQEHADQIVDLSLADGRLNIDTASTPDQTKIDARNLWLMPAMVDVSHHLAAPADSPRSTIEHELRAAWKNGFRRICAAPDTQPRIDNSSVIEWIERRALAEGELAELDLLGALTVGLEGQQLSNMASLISAGCVGLSQADTPLPQPALLRQALRYAADLGIRVHLQPQLRDQFPGCAHDATLANVMGLSGIPSVSESLAIASIVELVRDTHCSVHLSKLTSAEGVQQLRTAQKQGLPVSGDVAIHNLLFTDQAISDFDTRCHLDPPLRNEQDRQALIAGLADGTLAAICSDHRPLGFDDKFGPFADTKAGANGIDGFLAACLTLSGAVDPLRLAHSLSAGAEALMPERKVKHPVNDWLIVAPDAKPASNTKQHSQSKHSLLLQQNYPGCLIGRITAGQWHIDSHWQQELGV